MAAGISVAEVGPKVIPALTLGRVLVAEDQPHVLEALYLLLKGEGYQTELASSPSAVLEAVAARPFDAVLMDLNYARDTTSGREGLDLLARLQKIDGDLPVVVMTAWGSVDLAVEAMHRGARDFIQKPWQNARLLEILRAQISEGRARRIEHSLRRQESEDAAQTQHGLLPREIPCLPGFRISVAWQPARSVGGDYYDLIPFGLPAAAGLPATAGGQHLALAIGDVAGKGMPAALLMSNLQAAVRALATPEISPAELCARLNTLVGANLGTERFITLFYALLDAEQRTLRFTRAGHCAPILVHGDGTNERLEAGGGVLAVANVAPPFQGGMCYSHPPEQVEECGAESPALPNAYDEGCLQLRSGDRLVLFTDGIPEARNAAGAELGEELLVALAVQHRTAGAEDLRDILLHAARARCGGQFQDDATLIVLAVD